MKEVLFSPEAHAQAMELPLSVRTRVLATAERLRHWPEVSGYKRLTGPWAGRFRIRTGDYRIIFQPRDQVIRIVKVGHRKDIYED